MATQITANLPTLNFPREVDYPTQEDWAAFSAAAELNFGILGGDWSTQMQLWKTQANAMSIESNNNADIAQSIANFQGEWVSQGYTLGQSVSVSGVYYICKLTHITGQNPTTGGSIYWNLALGNWNLKVNTNMSGYTAKTTPTDDDLIPLSDSDSIFGIKKLSWANVKATLKTYFDTLYVPLSGNSATATKLQTARTINGVLFDGSADISVGLNSQSAVFTTTFTLDSTHKNKVVICDGTFNISLPTVSTINSGDLFIITNAGTGTLTIVANGNSTDLSRLTILAGEALIIQSDGGSYYRLVSRSKDYASDISNTGYTYLPNGLIMQWGRLTINIAPSEDLSITFPVSFPNDVCYSNVAILNTTPNNGSLVPYVSAPTTSNLVITNSDGDSIITQIRWFSIGY